METVKRIAVDQLNLEFVPPTIYKYRMWSDIYHQKFITERQLYFSHPKIFEDIKDCRVPVAFDFSYEKILTTVKMRLEPLGLDERVIRTRALSLYSERFSTDEKIEQRKKEFYEDMNDRLGIFSAARRPNLKNMWIKYSNDYNGFCLGFDYRSVALEVGEKYGIGVVDIVYNDKLPILKDPFGWGQRDYESFIFHYVNNKESSWSKEDELRLFIIYYSTIYPTVNISDRQITLPRSAFKEIIFGHNLSSKNRDEIYNAVKEANIHVKFKETQIVNGQVLIKDL